MNKVEVILGLNCKAQEDKGAGYKIIVGQNEVYPTDVINAGYSIDVKTSLCEYFKNVEEGLNAPELDVEIVRSLDELEVLGEYINTRITVFNGNGNDPNMIIGDGVHTVLLDYHADDISGVTDSISAMVRSQFWNLKSKGIVDSPNGMYLEIRPVD